MLSAKNANTRGSSLRSSRLRIFVFNLRIFLHFVNVQSFFYTAGSAIARFCWIIFYKAIKVYGEKKAKNTVMLNLIQHLVRFGRIPKQVRNDGSVLLWDFLTKGFGEKLAKL